MTINAEKMKAGRPHVLPLPKQALTALRALQVLTGSGEYVFPCVKNNASPMSANACKSALGTLGYTGKQMTWHGFRAMFSTVANRNGFPSDIIEEQLAHKDKDITRRAYNRATYLPQRAALMQWWADYLDAMRDNAQKPAKPDLSVIG